MEHLLKHSSQLFDTAREIWQSKKTHWYISILLVAVFLITLAVIEVNRMGWLPPELGEVIPESHYFAINLAFLLVLILEVLSLLFTLPSSMSRALGKQFEILALIFLRSSFKELTNLPEPISIAGKYDVLWHIMAYGAGALVIFALLGVYLLLQKKLDNALKPGPALARFIQAKKTVALIMLVIFFGLGIYDGWMWLNGGEQFDFFHYFYTILIFSDILLVLIAQSYLPQFAAIFRNSGYALATLLIRLSLTAPVYYDVGIGVFSVLLALFLTLVYNRFYAGMTS